MKRILFTLFILINITAFSQNNHGNIWYFGGEYSHMGYTGAGLDFNSGTPVALTNSGMCFTEGCASRCDGDGQLMFYAKGDSVYDKTHNMMQNGDSLMGHFSSQQSALIVPMPGDDYQYYLFTNDGHNTSLGTGLYYAIIDMRLNGGLGAVVSKGNHLVAETGEQLTGTVHSNGTDFWVLTNDYDSSRIYAYHVSSAGISPPIINNLGVNEYCAGNMKMSPDGSKLAIKYWGVEPRRYIYDFNTTTGILTNPDTLKTDNFNGGCEFSPDGNLLYEIRHMDSLCQYDLNAPNIQASVITIAYGVGIGFDLKTGPDGKIYITHMNPCYYLDVINNPNVVGTNCNYQQNAIYLSGKSSGASLPNVTLVPSSVSSVSENNSENIDFNLSPNPLIDFSVLKFDNSLNSSHTLHVYDLDGRLVQVIENIYSEEVKIEKGEKVSGIYLLKLFKGSMEVLSAKLIVL